MVTSLKDYIARRYGARRTAKSPTARRPLRKDVGEVRVMSSLGLDAASVALPAGSDLEDRAARMNDFWKALVDYQHRDVIVVALCAGDGR